MKNVIVLGVLSLFCELCAGAPPVIRQITTPTNELVYDSPTNTIFASIPSTAPNGTGNTIKKINPLTLAVSNGVFVGSEPTVLARSDNGQYLYVGLSGSAAVRRYDIASETAGIQFSLGADLGPNYPEDLAVMPGYPETLAVSRRNVGFSPRHEGVAIYDNGVQRTTTTPGHTGSNRIEFSDSSTPTLYGYNNETTEFGVRTMTVSPTGVTTVKTTGSVITGFGVDIEYAGGRLYSTSGKIVDPIQHTLIGSFPSSGLIEADPNRGRMFFLNSTSGYQIQAFDLNTFVPLGSFTVPGVVGTPTSLIRWGNDGLAFRTATQVFLINTDLVPEPATILGMLCVLPLLRRTRRGVSRAV